MAEREGFEPSMGYKTHTPLAGERLQPLGHLSVKSMIRLQLASNACCFLRGEYYLIDLKNQTLFYQPGYSMKKDKNDLLFA